MQNAKQLVLTRNDYELIMANLKYNNGKNTFNKEDAQDLVDELKKAKLVMKEEVPEDVVRLNSRVKISDDKDKKVMEVTIVTPDKVDIRQQRISITSPIGTALIGYRKGNKIKWRVPAGIKTFTILEVNNAFA
jgi:regulator of nucleoside diphosphate kinase